MLFNSLDFGIFLLIIFFIYWILLKDNLKSQNLLLLISSYYFYSYWDNRFLFLLIFSTLVDYLIGIKIQKITLKKNKLFWLWFSISLNLGVLVVFKYFNFFIEGFKNGALLFGYDINTYSLNIILPIGISFYTFHGLSYVIDIYKNKIIPKKNLINYSLFVSFFPLLVAGPIERATHLLPQIKHKREFDYRKTVDGLRQILWGFFKKIVIADSCAGYSDMIFNHSIEYSGSTHVIGAFFFAIQIYCDFSGYSDIAIGTARLFGIELLRNFSFPYFSRDIAEFWRRWHISLSSWFKDYVYIPLGGNKVSRQKIIRNVFIIFILSGLWHGANVTYIIWGLLHSFYILPSILFKTNRKNLDIVAKGKIFPTFKEFTSMLITFSLVVFAWIFFRAENINQALEYLSILFSHTLFQLPDLMPIPLLLLLLCFIIIEWYGREELYAISNLFMEKKRIYRWSFYLILLLFIYSSSGKQIEFIYFQF